MTKMTTIGQKKQEKNNNINNRGNGTTAQVTRRTVESVAISMTQTRTLSRTTRTSRSKKIQRIKDTTTYIRKKNKEEQC